MECLFGSAQQSVKVRILRGFLKSDEFGLSGCHALCFQQHEMPEFVVIGTTPVFRGMRKGILISSERRVHSNRKLQADSVSPECCFLLQRTLRRGIGIGTRGRKDAALHQGTNGSSLLVRNRTSPAVDVVHLAEARGR